MRRIRVIVADDHPLFRASLVLMVKEAPELELVGQAEDGREALEMVRNATPDVAVVDVRMPALDGWRVLAAVRGDELDTRVVLLTGAEEDREEQAMAAGAAGFVAKTAGPDTIRETIVAAGRGARAPRRSGDRLTEPRLLSPREREVLALVAQGRSAPEAARDLHLSAATVRTHLQHIYCKLGVSDRAAAVAQAIRRGIIE